MSCLNNLHIECFQCLWQHLKKILMNPSLFRTVSTNVEKYLVFLTRKSHHSINLKQYESLPNFKDICKNVKNCRWDLFCDQAKKAGLLAELSEDILFFIKFENGDKFSL